jgi:hypothetical protein
MIPEINTRLSAAVDRFELFAQDGTPTVAVAIKLGFRWNERGELEDDTDVKVRYVDEPWPDFDSVRLPGDLFLRKRMTDVVVAGTAFAPDEGARHVDAGIEIGAMRKFVRVFGPRVWYRGMLGTTLTPPEPFDSLPVVWEHAIGGMDTSDPKKAEQEERNPLGIGIAVDAAALEHKPGPRIEDPNDLISSARSRPNPAGLCARGPDFSQRRRFAGTFDQRWAEERMPLPPLDFDERFNQVAVEELISPEYLRGGEPVKLLNLGKHGVQSFVLPRRVFSAVVHRDDLSTEPLRPDLDTIVILPDARKLEMTWRTRTPNKRGRRAPRSIAIFMKEGV